VDRGSQLDDGIADSVTGCEDFSDTQIDGNMVIVLLEIEFKERPHKAFLGA